MDDWMGGAGVKLCAVCIVITKYMSCKFYDRELHSEAEPEERDSLCTGIPDCFQLAVNSAVAKASGNKDSAYIAKEFLYIFCIDCF